MANTALLNAAKVVIGDLDTSVLCAGEILGLQSGTLVNPGVSFFGGTPQGGVARAAVMIGPPVAVPGLGALPASLEVTAMSNFLGNSNIFGIATNNGLSINNGASIGNGANIQLGVDTTLGFITDIGYTTEVGGHIEAIPSAFTAVPFNPNSAILHDFYGVFRVNGAPVLVSDIKLKKNIEPLKNCLDKVLQLQGVEYDRIDYEGHELGLVAQEVEKIIPQVIHNGEHKSIAYTSLIPVLIEAIKEQQQQIEDLKRSVQELSTPCPKCSGLCYDV